MAKSKLLTVKLVLTGAKAGRSIALNGHNFIGGVATLTSDEKGIASMSRYLGRAYKAFPEGSPELAAAQKADEERLAAEAAKKKEAKDGKRNSDAGKKRDETDEVPGGVQSDGSGASEEASDDGGSDGDSEAGGAGSDSGGDRHQDARVVSEPSIDDKAVIAEAVAKLDPKNDDHWTADGKPAVAVVTELAGRNVSRQLLNVIVPDVTRDSAKAD